MDATLLPPAPWDQPDPAATHQRQLDHEDMFIDPQAYLKRMPPEQRAPLDSWLSWSPDPEADVRKSISKGYLADFYSLPDEALADGGYETYRNRYAREVLGVPYQGAVSDESFFQMVKGQQEEMREDRIHREIFADMGFRHARVMDVVDPREQLVEVAKRAGGNRDYVDAYLGGKRVMDERIGSLRAPAMAVRDLLAAGAAKLGTDESGQEDFDLALDIASAIPDDALPDFVAMLNGSEALTGEKDPGEKGGQNIARGLMDQLRGFASRSVRGRLLDMESSLRGGGRISLREGEAPKDAVMRSITETMSPEPEGTAVYNAINTRPASDEENKAAIEFTQKALKRNVVAGRLLDILQSKIDPATSDDMLARALYQGAYSVGAMAPSFIPYIGVAIAQGGYADTEFRRQIRLGTDISTAHEMANVTGAVQAGLERLGVLGHIAGANRVASSFAGSAVGKALTPLGDWGMRNLSRIPGSGAVEAVAQHGAGKFFGTIGMHHAMEYLEETAQDAAPIFTAKMAEGMGLTLPQAASMSEEIRNFKFWNPELYLTLLPITGFAGGIHGVGAVLENRAAIEQKNALLSDTSAMIAAGASEADAARILSLPPEERPAAWGNVNLDPSTETAGQAQQEVTEKIHQEAQAAQELQQAAGVSEVRRTDSGWEVVRDDGTSIPVSSPEAAAALMENIREGNSQADADAVVQMTDFLMGSEKSPFAETVTFSKSLETAAERISKGADPDAIYDRLRVEAAREGADVDAGTTWILGENQLQFRERVGDDARRIVEASNSRVNRLGNVLTVIEEPVEGRWKAGLQSGIYTPEQGIKWVRLAERFSGEKLLDADADADVSPAGLTEGVSRMVVMDVLGRRKDGGRAPAGVISRGLSAATAASAEGKGLRAFLNAWKARFSQMFRAAARLAQARQSGEFSENQQGYDDFIDSLLKLDGQAAHNAAVAESAQDQGSKSSFSVSSSEYLDRLAASIDSRSTPPAERLRRMSEAAAEMRGMARSMRFNDEGRTVDRAALREGVEARQAAESAALEEAQSDALDTLRAEQDVEKGGAREDGWTADQRDALNVRHGRQMDALKTRQREERRTLKEKHTKELAALNSAPADARKDQLRALAALDAILMKFPAEVRGKVGGFTKLAGLTTNEAREAFLRERIGKLEEVFERHLKKEFSASMDKLLDRSKLVKGEAGEKKVGRLGADTQHLMDAIRAAMEMNATDVSAEIAKLNTKIASGELTAEQEALALRERELVSLAGDWKNADSGTMEAALKAATQTFEGGWLDWQQRQVRRRERREAARDELAADTGKAGTAAERDEKLLTDNGLRGKVKRVALGLSSFDDVVRYAFGENSEQGRKLTDDERAAAYQYSDEMAGYSDKVSEFFTEIANGSALDGEKLRYKLSQKSIQIGGRKLSNLEAAQALLMWAQEDGQRHMLGPVDENGAPAGKWRYDQAWVDDLRGKMSPEGLKVLDFLSKDYAAEWAELNPYYRERFGVNLPRHDNYAPVTVAPVQAKAGEMVDPVTGQAISGSIISPGSLRTRSRTAIAEPKFRDALQTWLGHKKQLAYWKAYYDFATESQAILGNRDVMNSVEAAGGAEASSVLRKWVEYFAQGGNRDAGAGLEANRWLNRTSGRAARMALVGRLGTLMIQGTQLGAAVAEMPAGAYISRLGQLFAGQIGWSEALRSDFIQRRMRDAPPIVRQAMEGLESVKPNVINHAVQRLGQLIPGADALFTAGTYAILLDYHTMLGKQAGLSGAALSDYAHAEATRATERVAQPTRPGARSIFENTATSPLSRLSWAFASEARQKMALAAWAARNAVDNPARAARAAFVVWGVGGLMAAVIRNAWRDRRDDDDDEIFDGRNWDWKQLIAATIAGPLNGIPAIGDAVELAIFKGAGAYAPEGNLFTSLGRSVPAVKDLFGGGFLDKPEQTEQLLRDVEAILTAAGLANETLASLASVSHAVKDAANVVDSFSDSAEEADAHELQLRRQRDQQQQDAKEEARRASLTQEQRDREDERKEKEKADRKKRELETLRRKQGAL